MELKMSENLNGKVALVTGSSQGLGAVIAKLLATEGCHVYINCAHNIDKAKFVAAEIIAEGGSAEVLKCDITNEEELTKKFESLKAIDILVNNARLDPYARGADDTEAGWFAKILSVNLIGAHLATLAVIDKMKERRWGRIINVSSVQAYLPIPRKLIPYSASKIAMHALTRSFALEAAPYGVTVNTVAPGVVLTENIGKRLSEEEIAEKMNNLIPLKRGASSEEVAEAIINTIKSGYITGETVNINGGLFFAV
jgi:3-oxoacyl-[acyl-carrier protein] reductase